MAITDNFSGYSNGVLPTVSGGVWANGATGGVVTVTSNTCYCSTKIDAGATAYYDSSEWEDDQEAEVTLSAVDTSSPYCYAGPGVRLGVDQGYIFVATGSFAPYVYRIDAGPPVDFLQLGYAGADYAGIGDVVKITIVGSEITTSIDGVQQHNFDSDTTYSSGKPGIGFRNTGTDCLLDTWQGTGEIAASTDVGDSRKTIFVIGGGYRTENYVNTW